MKSKGGFLRRPTPKLSISKKILIKFGWGRKDFFGRVTTNFFLYIYNVGPALFRLGGTTRDNVDLIGNVILRSPLAGYL